MAAARGDVVETWYQETKSAKTTARPELKRLRDDARMGKLGTVYVFKLDRLVRSGVADTFMVVDGLRRAGVTLVAVADNLKIVPDKEDVTSEVLIFALGLAARLERTAINDRISAARRGSKPREGLGVRLYQDDGPTTARARTMRTEGRSIREIAVALKVPRATLGRALARAPDPRDGRS